VKCVRIGAGGGEHAAAIAGADVERDGAVRGSEGLDQGFVEAAEFATN
jgi:hypothetical protein